MAYDSNETTGGVGARYLGIGGDKKYRSDVVTVNLRLVNSITSEVLLSTTTTKTIYAYLLQGGTYKFIAFDKLLEIEAGVSKNELGSLAVRHAIELGVFSLIVEGAREGIWRFRDRVEGKKVVRDYDEAYNKQNVETN